MSPPLSISRAVLASVLMAALVATAGCSWLRRSSDLYSGDPALRPLEVPPPLPDENAAPVEGSATASAVAAAKRAPGPAALGFNATGTRDEVFGNVGAALEAIDGVRIASRAQLLGAYDVEYKGSNFLVRVSEIEGGAYVSAVDPRGVPASGEGPTELVGMLQAALGGQ
ncbi:hypothetical protein [Marilutibacter aestuarii]|uniref:Beta-barrel assembly machine subunit BamC n=1 Tax=Marilutibacter aestuarii TaxID=1706195 RepID=A0A507ZY44_9GAMM|nr:hypothetical protein [Lysobacter aestuarii]TQD41481.1 hypothetical protein FKV25_12845 [Lysobacter aestuarii]